MSTQVKLEGRPFWSGQGVQIYHLNYLLPTYSGNVNYYKSVNYPIPTLPVGTGSTLTIFKTNQFTLVSIEFPDIFSSCANWRGKERPFWEGCKNGDHITRLSLGWYKRWKRLSFSEIWNRPYPHLFFIRSPYKQALQDMDFYGKLVDIYQELS